MIECGMSSQLGLPRKEMKKILRTIRLSDLVIVGSIVLALALFFALGAIGGFAGGGPWKLALYYADALGNFSSLFFYSAVSLLCFMTILFVAWGTLGNFLGLFTTPARHSHRAEQEDGPFAVLWSTLRRLGMIFIIIPALFFVLLVALVMGEANAINRTRLYDGAIIGWEQRLTGHYIFAALGSVEYPHWLIVSVIWSFTSMSAALIASGVIVTFINKELIREMVVAFCIGTLLCTFIWLMVPALSPQDRYIDNIYTLPISPQIALAVQGYHPQPEIAHFLAETRTIKASLPDMPTSTMPSAHIFWAAIAAYYLFRAKKWLGWIALPFFLASSFGTVLLAQHYLMDIPAALFIAGIAVWIARIAAEYDATLSSLRTRGSMD